MDILDYAFLQKAIDKVAKSLPTVNIGKFLALWDCSTGLPETDPADGVPYTYTTGDFYIISAVDSTTNYMPNGSTYDGTASTTADSGHTEINDMYFYDGALWRRLKNSEPSLSTEAWTFTLEDGTTVTKNVVVSG